MKITAGITVALFVTILSCGRRSEVEEIQMGLGSYIRIRAVGADRERIARAVKEAFSEMHRLDTLWSSFLPGSEVARLNRERRLRVSSETRELILKAVQVAESTGGAFDITIEPLERLWGFYDGAYRVPDSSEVRRARERVDYRKVRVSGDTVILGAGVNLDLGGIAVGYAVDRAVELLKAGGAREGLVDAGGDIRVFGERVWRIGVQNPRGQGVVRVLRLKDRAVATSGDYEKFFEQGGRRYCHIIHPKTGYPADHWAAVTVVAPSAVEADAYSTAMFVLGAGAVEWIKKKAGLGAVFFEATGDSVQEKAVGRFE